MSDSVHWFCKLLSKKLKGSMAFLCIAVFSNKICILICRDVPIFPPASISILSRIIKLEAGWPWQIIFISLNKYFFHHWKVNASISRTYITLEGSKTSFKQTKVISQGIILPWQINSLNKGIVIGVSVASGVHRIQSAQRGKHCP